MKLSGGGHSVQILTSGMCKSYGAGKVTGVHSSSQKRPIRYRMMRDELSEICRSQTYTESQTCVHDSKSNKKPSERICNGLCPKSSL